MAESKSRGFGERLRRAREEAGRDVKGLAEVTRVQGRYIQALEDEDWSVVPRGVIGRGFVRVLARELSLPPAELVQLYQAARGDADSEPERALPEVDWKVDLGAGRKKGPLLAAGAVLVLAALGFWWWHRSSPHTEVPSPAPAAPARPASAPAPAAAARAPLVPASPKTQVPAAAQTAGLRLEVEARGRVWVRVAQDGEGARERVLKSGEKVVYRAKTGFHLKLGNAGAVKLYWNGEALKAPGRSSEVVTLSLPKDLPSLQP